MLKRGKNGFTLIEILVVMVIIALFSIAVFANYQSGQKKYVLSQAIQMLVSDLRRAQNMAIAGVEISGICEEGSGYACYGFYADQEDDFYVIFGDKNNNKTLQPSDIIIETINLPEQVKIKSVSNSFDATTKTNVFFEPPIPTVYINGDSDIGWAKIVLELEGTTLEQSVTVTTVGLIQVD